MLQDDLIHILLQKPFEPIRLVLSDGAKYDIYHPDLVLVEFSIVRIGHPAAQLTQALTHREVIVSLDHIVRIEPIEPKPKSVAPVSTN